MNYAQNNRESGGPWLRNAYIKFRTTEDRTQGCDELLPHSPVSCLSNDVFCIPWKSLIILDARQVEYSFASEDDLSDARPLWNFAAAR
jgi:hypothetical protein